MLFIRSVQRLQKEQERLSGTGRIICICLHVNRRLVIHHECMRSGVFVPSVAFYMKSHTCSRVG